MDVLVAINVLIATQQELEDAYVVAQQAINYPPVVGLGEMPRLRRLQSPLLEPRLGQNPRVSPSQRLYLRKEQTQHGQKVLTIGACSYPRFRCNTLPSPLALVVRRRH